MMGAADDLDECRLAGAVVTDQAVTSPARASKLTFFSTCTAPKLLLMPRNLRIGASAHGRSSLLPQAFCV